MDLGLLQREVAQRLGVSAASVWQWENNRTGPQVRFMPAIRRFIGCDVQAPAAPEGRSTTDGGGALLRRR